jgi:alpha-galactosidase
MIFSLCEWGTSKPWEWAAEVGHLWRTTGDIYRCFEGLKDMGTWRANCVMRNVDLQADLRQYAGPDHWNDPDMLEVGNGMTEAEDRAHFSLWCMMAAPLIAGNDLRSISQTTLHILSQKELVAIDQDPLGIQGFRVMGQDSIETWYKPLKGNDWAICLLNRSSRTQKVRIDWNKQQVLDSLTGRKLNTGADKMRARDLWAGKDLGQAKGVYEATLASHDVIVLRLNASN